MALIPTRTHARAKACVHSACRQYAESAYQQSKMHGRHVIKRAKNAVTLESTVVEKGTEYDFRCGTYGGPEVHFSSFSF